MRTPACPHNQPLVEGEPNGRGETLWRCPHGCVWSRSPAGAWRKRRSGIPPASLEAIELRSRAMGDRYGL